MPRVWDHNLTVPLRPRCLEAVLVASTSSEVDCIEGGKNQSGIFILTLIYHVHICNVLVARGETLLHGKTPLTIHNPVDLITQSLNQGRTILGAAGHSQSLR